MTSTESPILPRRLESPRLKKIKSIQKHEFDVDLNKMKCETCDQCRRLTVHIHRHDKAKLCAQCEHINLKKSSLSLTSCNLTE